MQADLRGQSFTGISASFIAAVLVCLTFATVTEQPTGTWREAGALSEVRAQATATELADGRVLITGGANHGIPLASAEIISPSGAVKVVSNMSIARAGHTATRLLDGRVLIAGGTTIGRATSATADVFDPRTETWTQVSMHAARAHHTATLVSGSGDVVVTGGEDASGSETEILSSIEIFDPRAGSFRVFDASLLTPRTSQSAAVLPTGEVLIAGGRDRAGALASTEIVALDSGTVRSGPTMIQARAEATATDLLDGTVLIAGGTDGARDLSSAERFSLAAGRFASAGSLVMARRGHAAVRLPQNNGVLIVGGTGGGEPLLQAEVFEPARGVFRASGLTLVPHGVAVVSGTGREGVAMVAAGADTALAETHRFATIRTTRTAYGPGERVTIVGSGWLPGETVGLMLQARGGSPIRIAGAVADEFGNIINTDFTVPAAAGAGLVVVSAVGSAAEAQNAFNREASEAGHGAM